MYRHHGYWGGGGWGWGGPFMRRGGFPLFGGMGLGMGSGGGLLGDLMAGGLGYMMGRQQGASQNQQYPPQYQQAVPQYQQYPPQYQQYPQYQQAVPQYQPPPTQGDAQNSQLAQLRLLGRLHDSGVLTNDEFQAEKQKILNGF